MSETSETQVTVSDSSTEVVSVPEDFQNFIMRGDKICAMSTPPAEFSDTGPNLDLNLGEGEEKIDAGTITSVSNDLGETTYMLDQLLYRLCEAGLSYNLTKAEYLEFYIKTLEIAVQFVGTNFDAQLVEALYEQSARRSAPSSSE